jgi:hypothetical protein
MSSLRELKSGDVSGILATIVIGGFAFYFAVVLSDAVTLTVNAIIPDSKQEVLIAWINFFVAIVIVIIGVYLIVQWFNHKDEDIDLIVL